MILVFYIKLKLRGLFVGFEVCCLTCCNCFCIIIVRGDFMKKRYFALKIILTIFVIFLMIIYIIFRGILNLWFPWNDYIIRSIAQYYVKDNISEDMEQVNKIEKNYKEGYYNVKFYSPYNNIFFDVLVDSKTFKVFKNTFKENLFNAIVHENMDDYFKKIFEDKARFELFFDISDFNLNKNCRRIELKELNNYCNNINLYIHINYFKNIDKKEDENKILELIKYMSEKNLNFNKVFIMYYSNSKIQPDYSYELKF